MRLTFRGSRQLQTRITDAQYAFVKKNADVINGNVKLFCTGQRQGPYSSEVSTAR
jgi:hypothetical protein